MRLKLQRQHKEVIGYALAMAILISLMRVLEYQLLVVNYEIARYAGIIAIIFTLLGVWISKMIKPNSVNPPTPFLKTTTSIDQNVIDSLGISKRELEVLQLMAAGHSNKEIGELLFVSENTVKSHAARLFEKLEVKRRTQAVDKAKTLNILD